jgi:hypothetical protein
LFPQQYAAPSVVTPHANPLIGSTPPPALIEVNTRPPLTAMGAALNETTDPLPS